MRYNFLAVRNKLVASCAAATFFIAFPASAQDINASASANMIAALTQCRSIRDDGARLACFDSAAAILAAAGEVAIVTRQDVAQNQRRLFGFSVSALNPFDSSGRSDNLQSISATMTGARDLGRGEWLITLDDGSVWRKTDSADVQFSTRRQYPVTVRRASLGSYMMKVGDAPPFRVKRE
ncbi:MULTISPECIES: hypothetical protein [unclassified Brevundimonas]|uniref:hypothetical protein n=1 Tax=unclassified Brevundimonas TaxID=2622653 RepID=UPI00200621E0|nr:MULTISPECIES: hypothetical protein [unclassified Brevundimonas]MCK6103390.1 hypothetical protein [Brevundimonas sp. EYE_349]